MIDDAATVLSDDLAGPFEAAPWVRQDWMVLIVFWGPWTGLRICFFLYGLCWIWLGFGVQ